MCFRSGDWVQQVCVGDTARVRKRTQGSKPLLLLEALPCGPQCSHLENGASSEGNGEPLIP